MQKTLFYEIHVLYFHDGFVANKKIYGFVRGLMTGFFIFHLDIVVALFCFVFLPNVVRFVEEHTTFKKKTNTNN